MESLEENMAVFEAEIKNVFCELKTNGFDIKNACVKNTLALGDYAEVLISNALTGRSLLFMYIPGEKHQEGITVFIQNGNTDTFSIDDYLIHHGVDFQSRQSLKIANYHGSFKERLCGVLNASKEIISRDMAVYLFTPAWKSIPIQWGDMK